MTSREEKKLLVDIIDSVNAIDDHLENKRILEEYLSNKTKRRAVEREIEIIGEAINKLLKINPEIAISYARTIVNLRNKVIHAYDSVDDILIWKIIIKDLPILLEEVTKLLHENN
ncbi:HepT-like ribonuclease domain-containing protein [Flavobacterium sp.]|uniref:HepT-like ribonuclease domain-containing protein n=1 Tax=Flavobacterium sp. TaxID=239 RepID=UPI0026110CD1|nr:HepT-like ribonuclease domain-containing protein [Flavobacterium sp.]